MVVCLRICRLLARMTNNTPACGECLAACGGSIPASLDVPQAKLTPSMPRYGPPGCGASTSLLQSPTDPLLRGLTLDAGIDVSTNHVDALMVRRPSIQ